MNGSIPSGGGLQMELTVDQALQQGVAAHKEGKLQDAERLYRAILQAQRNHPDANHNLGVLAVAVGKPLEAIPLFKLALEGNPQIEQFWLSYIDALLKAERLEEANQALADASRSGISSEKLGVFHEEMQHASPSQDQLNRLLGLYQSGSFTEAEEFAVSLTQQFPKHPFGWKVLGAIYKQAGKPSESLAAKQKTVELSPQDAEAHNNLGNSLRELGRLDEAEASCKQAIALKPDYAEAHNNLGNTLQELVRLDEAEASCKQAIALKPDYAEAHNNLGATLKKLGRLNEAEISFRQSIALKPDYVEAQSNLSVMLKALGKLDEAAASLRQVIAIEASHAESHRSLATIKKYSSRDEQFYQMKAVYRDPNISEDHRCQICFALAKASEDLEDFARAFRFYSEGNALRKKQLGYDKERDAKLFEVIKTSHRQIKVHSLKPASVASEHAPIFIVGMPRSGTTLVEQIISSHPLVTGAGELPFVSEFGSPLAVGQTLADGKVLRAFREQYLGALKQRSEGRAIVTDKMPQNFRFLGLIAAALPEAKIIHVKRDPAAVCWANYTQYFVGSGSLNYCYDLDDIVHYHELYRELMRYWHHVLSGRVYDLEYEFLTEHQEEESRKLIDFLQLSWQEACLLPEENERGVVTTSNLQVREKMYRGSSGRWKRYKPYLNGALDHFESSRQ
jgi:tetratricopeptide (TPR) repeat protein